MKALVCEMCSSTDIIKQDGVYVCQSCGTKYSVEEAKKIMIEGNVDVSGSTVKIDKSDDNKNTLILARRGINGNWSDAKKYYSIIMQNDPANIEAIFYTAYSEFIQSPIAERFNSSNKVEKAFQVMAEQFDPSKDNKQVVDQIWSSIFSKHPQASTSGEDWYYVRITKAFIAFLENVSKKVSTKSDIEFYLKLAVKAHEFALSDYLMEKANVVFFQDSILKFHKLIHEVNPAHAIPSSAPASALAGKNSAQNFMAIVIGILCVIVVILWIYAKLM